MLSLNFNSWIKLIKSQNGPETTKKLWSRRALAGSKMDRPSKRDESAQEECSTCRTTYGPDSDHYWDISGKLDLFRSHKFPSPDIIGNIFDRTLPAYLIELIWLPTHPRHVPLFSNNKYDDTTKTWCLPNKGTPRKNVCTICSKAHLCLEQSILIEHMTSEQTRFFRRQLQEV